MPKPNLSLAASSLADLNEALYAIESIDLDDWGLTISDSNVEYADADANTVFAGPATAEGTPAFRALVTADLPDNGVTNAKIRDSAALSVIGNGTNATADPADIAAGTDGHVLRRSGTTLAFGTVADSALSSNVALKDGTNTWSAKQTLSVAPEFTLGFTERGRSVASGVWQAYAYNAANFTAQTGNWTVDEGDQVVRYTMFGKSMALTFAILGTDVSATPTYLAITLPESVTSDANYMGVVWYNDAAAGWNQGYLEVNGTEARIYKSPAAATFTATSADDTSVIGQVLLGFS